MRSNTTIFLAIALCAGLATGCGSDSGNGGGATTTTDTTGGTDTATGGSDTAASSDTTGGGSDTSTGGGSDTTTGGTDTAGGTDTSTGADTGGTDPNAGKCEPTDQLCVQNCGTTKCGKELSACTTNPKCAGLYPCVAGCQQTPPVSPPAEVTGTTCEEKCQTLAGADAYKQFVDSQLCLSKNCVKSAYDPAKKCAATDDACVQDCMLAECEAQMKACNDDTNCTGILTCAQGCGSDQSCLQGCVSKAPATSQQNFNGFVLCVQLSCLAQ